MIGILKNWILQKMNNRTLIWCCPRCARTVKCMMFDCWMPNIICQCNLPTSVTMMVSVDTHVEGSEG